MHVFSYLNISAISVTFLNDAYLGVTCTTVAFYAAEGKLQWRKWIETWMEKF